MSLKVSSIPIKKTEIYTKRKYHQDQEKFKNGQKRGLLKRSVIFRNLIVAFGISLLLSELKSLDPYKRILQ